MANSHFKKAIEFNNSEQGNPTDILRTLDLGVKQCLGGYFTSAEIDRFTSSKDGGLFEFLSQEIFMAKLQAISLESNPAYSAASEAGDDLVAIGLLMLSRREVIKDKLASGEKPSSLVGQHFQEEIGSKLKAMQHLLTTGWRPSNVGYLRENLTPENEGLLIEIFRILASAHNAIAYPYKYMGDGYTAIALDKPDTIPLTGSLFYYPDNYELIIKPELTDQIEHIR